MKKVKMILILVSALFLLTYCTKAPELPQLQTVQKKVVSVVCKEGDEKKDVSVSIDKIADSKINYKFNCKDQTVSDVDLSEGEFYAKGASVLKIIEALKEQGLEVSDLGSEVELKVDTFPTKTFLDACNESLISEKFLKRGYSHFHCVNFEDLNLSTRTSEVEYKMKFDGFSTYFKNENEYGEKIYEIETEYLFLDYKVMGVRAKSGD